MHFSTIDWSDMLALDMAPLEIILRGTLMFWFLFIIFRFVLRRDVGSLGVGDFLFVAIVADASQNAMSGDTRSVGDGVLLVSTLVFWNYALNFLGYHFPAVQRLAEPPPLMLVKDGKLLRKNMRRELITKDELFAKLREEGLTDVSEVKEMRLESDGEISLIKK